ncbi:MAG: CsgG/HfaB family protein [Fibrobacterales bacterium]
MNPRIALAFLDTKDLTGKKSKDLATILESKLINQITKSNTYQFVERDNLDKVLTEQSMKETGLTEGSNVELGGLSAAHHFLKLTINSYEEITDKNNLMFVVKYKQKVTLEVNVSVVSAQTGNVIFNKTYSSMAARKNETAFGIGETIDFKFKSKNSSLLFESIANQLITDNALLSTLQTHN